MAEAERDASPVRSLYQPRPHYSIGRQGGQRTKHGKLKNQYRLIDGGATAEVECEGPATSFFIDAEDIELIEAMTWKSEWDSTKKYFHISATLFGKLITLSRHIMQCYDSSLVVDHINSNRRENQKSNLRCVTHRENMMNRKLHKNNKTSYNGVMKTVKPARPLWTLRWLDSKTSCSRYMSWPRTDDSPPEEAMRMKAALETTGHLAWLIQKLQKESTQWDFQWIEQDGRRMHKVYAYTEDGKQKMLAFREATYKRIGNRNGLRTEYGDGIK